MNGLFTLLNAAASLVEPLTPAACCEPCCEACFETVACKGLTSPGAWPFEAICEQALNPSSQVCSLNSECIPGSSCEFVHMFSQAPPVLQQFGTPFVL